MCKGGRREGLKRGELEVRGRGELGKSDEAKGYVKEGGGWGKERSGREGGGG